MKKADRRLLDESLDKALAPRKPKRDLASLLDQYADEPSLPSPPSQPSTPSKATSPVAPMRDFQKVPNSLTRDAIPAGLFSGKGKQMYDYLYSLTRGAVVPKRSVRVTREALMKGSHIGAKVTLEQNIARLKAAGLISVRVIGGLSGGNEYTVFLPEEVAPLASLPSQPSPASNGENLASLAPLESSQPSKGLTVKEPITSAEFQTSFKTKDQINDDDAARTRTGGTEEGNAFAGLFEALTNATLEITGKSPGPADQARWTELAEVLMTELRIAAGRTTVSSVPAFLAEHLRRRLWKKEKRELEVEAAKVDSRADSAQEKLDISKCPDCGGTNMRYHDNDYSKGVEKCPHDKLIPSSE